MHHGGLWKEKSPERASGLGRLRGEVHLHIGLCDAHHDLHAGGLVLAVLVQERFDLRPEFVRELAATTTGGTLRFEEIDGEGGDRPRLLRHRRIVGKEARHLFVRNSPEFRGELLDGPSKTRTPILARTS